MEDKMKIGFIGLGIMGRPMALNILKGGYELTVWARRAQSMQPLLDAGAKQAADPADVARQSEIVISMVADSPDVREVMLGEKGVIKGAAPGSIAIDMSTILPLVAKEIAAKMKQQGVDFLDAPVSGGEMGAINGNLSIMVGGEAAAFLKANPVLACMGKTILHMGSAGAGQVTKAANQIMTGVGVLTVAEALNFARKNGVDPVKVRDALMGGSAYSRALEFHGLRMLERNFKPGFKAWMHQKDLNIVMQSAHESGVCLPASAAAAQMFNAMLGAGLGEEDTTALIKILESFSDEQA